MRTKVYSVIVLIVFARLGFGQSSFSDGLSKLANNVVTNIDDVQVKKLAIWDFTDLNGGVSSIGRFISEEVTVSIVNRQSGFQVIDRYHLEQILKEHSLKSEGLIDISTAKELGRIQAVDAIITGTVTILGDNIRVVMHVLETETGATISSGSNSFPMDNDVRALLGIELSSSNGNVNRGYNAPLNSNEFYNDPSTVVSDCNKNEVGDYCFTNSTKAILFVNLEWNTWTNSKGQKVSQGSKMFILRPQETTCVYSLPANNAEFKIRYDRAGDSMPHSTSPIYAMGYIKVEQCRSKTYIIK